MEMKANFHSHTQFCDGRSSMEEIVRAAMDAGYSIWGFTPHAPLCLPSPCNMPSESVKAYKEEIERLRKLFPQIKILAGMEVDFLNERHGPASEEVKSYDLDYIIGSVHFIPNQRGEYYDIDGSPERFKETLNKYFDGDVHYVVRTYWTQVQNMIKEGGFDIIGHIDKIALNASYAEPGIEATEEYRRLAEETMEMAVESGKEIEINTKHWKKYGRFFPHPRFWNFLIERGVKMPVDSDTHYAEKIEDGRLEAMQILSDIKGGNYSAYNGIMI